MTIIHRQSPEQLLSYWEGLLTALELQFESSAISHDVLFHYINKLVFRTAKTRSYAWGTGHQYSEITGSILTSIAGYSFSVVLVPSCSGVRNTWTAILKLSDSEI